MSLNSLPFPLALILYFKFYNCLIPGVHWRYNLTEKHSKILKLYWIVSLINSLESTVICIISAILDSLQHCFYEFIFMINFNAQIVLFLPIKVLDSQPSCRTIFFEHSGLMSVPFVPLVVSSPPVGHTVFSYCNFDAINQIIWNGPKPKPQIWKCSSTPPVELFLCFHNFGKIEFKQELCCLALPLIILGFPASQ